MRDKWRWLQVGITGAVLLFVALSTLSAAAVPPFRFGDESGNVRYIMSLVENRRIPHAQERVVPDFPGQGSPTQHTAKHPPLFYAIAAPAFWLGFQIGHPWWGFIAARGLSVSFGAATVALIGFLAFELTRRRRPEVGIAAALYAATLSPFVSVSGLVNTDALSAMWAALALLGLAGVVLRGFGRWSLACVFVGCVGGLLTRVQGIGVLGVCGLGLVLAAALASGRWSWRGAGHGTAWAAALAGACAATVGWFYWHNYRTYGDPTGGPAARYMEDHGTGRLSFVEVFFDPDTWLSLLLNVNAWLGRGAGWEWRATDLDISFAVLILIASGLLCWAARKIHGRRIASRRPELPMVLCGALLALLFVVIVLMVTQHVSTGGNLRNRYVFPALGAIASVAGLALLSLPGGRRGPFVVLVGGVQAGLSVAYIGYIAATRARLGLSPPEGMWHRLRFGLQVNEIPAPEGVLVVLLGVAAAGLLLGAIALRQGTS